MGQSKFTISLLGFDSRSADTLAQATRATMKIIDPISKGDTQVVVVDIDGSDGKAVWDDFREQWPLMPAVLVSSDDPDLDDASFAEKPFTVEALIDSITEAIILSPSIGDDSAESSESTIEGVDLTSADSVTEDSIESDLEELAPADEPFDEMDELVIQLTAADTTKPSSDNVSAGDSDAFLENEEAEYKSIMDRTGEIESYTEPAENESFESSPIEDSTPATDTWYAQDKTSSEEAYAMDELSHELNSGESAGYLSSETETNDPDDKTTVESMQDLEPESEPTVDEETAASDNTAEADISATDIADNTAQSLSHIASKLTAHSSVAGELPSRTLDSPNPEEIFFNPDAHMIGLVLKGVTEAAKSNSIAKLACLLDRTIYIDTKNKIISSNLKGIHMRQIAIVPLGKGENGLDCQLEMIESSSIKELSASDSSISPMESFIWELALLTSKGRAPIDTPMDKPTYLMQWPNFTQLMHTPNDMKIAAYWLRMPSSLIDLSENLDVPINDVRLMYSATSLTGLAGLATRKSDNMLRLGKPEEHENRNLFGSLMNKFKKQ